MSKKISLRVSNKTAYVWNVDDIATLRSEHHVCGILTGTLPHLSQQNVFLGIPLVLLPEEVVLLVQNEVATLIDDPSAHMQPSSLDLESWNAEQQASFRKQISLSEAKNAKKDNNRYLTDEALRKREARKRLAAQKLTAEFNDLDVNTPNQTLESRESENVGANILEPVSVVPRPATPDQFSSSTNYTIHITAGSEFSWYIPDCASYDTIENARDAGVWSYPSTLYERARCGVFKGLWEQGYFMGSGIKFGGDYLVYPGDPLRYHSHFVASVIESPSYTVRPMEVVAHGRLGTATKKSHLLCTWYDAKQEVSYLSIEWAGFG